MGRRWREKVENTTAHDVRELFELLAVDFDVADFEEAGEQLGKFISTVDLVGMVEERGECTLASFSGFHTTGMVVKCGG